MARNTKIFFLKKHSIDINADVGEGMKNDAQLMQFISSANIACGYHAGNIEIIKKTIELCLQNSVAIGAHPGFNDKINFGRSEIILTNDDYYNLISEQLYILQKYCKESNTIIHHVKPHGALYNMAATNKQLSNIIAKAVFDFNKELIVYGLSGSFLISEAKKFKLKTAQEVFADRTYQNNGTLTSRKHESALITNTNQALKQILQIIETETVTTIQKKNIPIKADTICLHGDGKHAILFVTSLYQKLKEYHFEVKTI